jgi:hypothetical protein
VSSVKDLTCLAGTTPTILQKRLTRLSYSSPYGYFTCSRNETTLSPFQDCLNLVSVYCQSTSPLFSNWNDCHSRVNVVRDQLNTNWKNWVNSCAKWLGADPSSTKCTSATTQLLNNEIYYWIDANNNVQMTRIPQSVTNSVVYLWST